MPSSRRCARVARSSHTRARADNDSDLHRARATLTERAILAPHERLPERGRVKELAVVRDLVNGVHVGAGREERSRHRGDVGGAPLARGSEESRLARDSRPFGHGLAVSSVRLRPDDALRARLARERARAGLALARAGCSARSRQVVLDLRLELGVAAEVRHREAARGSASGLRSFASASAKNA